MGATWCNRTFIHVSNIIIKSNPQEVQIWCEFDVRSFCSCVSAGLFYVGFSAFMFSLYSFMPVVMKRTSATSVNLSLLTADLYSLFCGLFLFHYKVNKKRLETRKALYKYNLLYHLCLYKHFSLKFTIMSSLVADTTLKYS